MAGTRLSRGLLALLLLACNFAGAESTVPKGDPLAAIDLNRTAIIADIVEGFEGDRAALTKRLSALRADHLLSASLASTRESLETILREGEKARDREVNRAGAKVLGSANSDLTYTPITPCRLIDTRGFGAPIQGGAFAPNARRAYTPNGLCGLPVAGVASMLVSFTTQNLTPNSGGYLAILGPGAPVTTTVDIFNLGSEWSASNTAVATGSAAQFDVLVANANAHLVVDILGYFAPPQGGAVTSITAGAGLTGGTITTTGTIGLAPTNLLPATACAATQIPKWSGTAWACAADNAGGGGGSVTSVATGTGLTGGPITATGTVSVANLGIGTAQLADNAVTFQKLADGSVGTSKIAGGSVGSGQIDSFSVQRRVSVMCSRGVPMIGINQDGTPICDNPASTIGVSTSRTTVVIRADGRPLVARDGGNLIDCADANCTTSSNININLGGDVALALRSDGRAVIATGNNTQSLVICGDATCSPGLRLVRSLDSGSIGVFSGIALRADNTPLVTYFEFNTGQTRLYVCNDPTCASGSIRTITASPSYTPSGMRIRPNGSPMIALRNYFGGGHALYDCNDASCSSGTIRGLGGGQSIRFLLGLAVRSDNRAIVVNGGPVMHDCADSVCSSNVAQPFDTGESIYASAAVIRSDGRPLLAYGTGFGLVKLFDCNDAPCSSGTARVVDQVSNSFSDQEISLALRPDGRAVLAYTTNNTNGLRVLSCQNATCQ